jgi:hypothetical protein
MVISKQEDITHNLPPTLLTVRCKPVERKPSMS